MTFFQREQKSNLTVYSDENEPSQVIKVNTNSDKSCRAVSTVDIMWSSYPQPHSNYD